MSESGGLQFIGMMTGMQNQTDARRIHGTADDIPQPTYAARQTSSDRQIQHPLSRLRHFVEHRRAARNDDASREHSLIPSTYNLSAHQIKYLFDARLDDLRQVLAGDGAGGTLSHARDLDLLGLLHHFLQGHAISDLDLFGFRLRSPQPDREVSAQVLTSDQQHGRVADAAFNEIARSVVPPPR